MASPFLRYVRTHRCVGKSRFAWIHATWGKTNGFLFIAVMVLLLSIADILFFTQVDEPRTKQIRLRGQQAVKQSSLRRRL